jgi:hypothetical protein
VHTLLWGLLGIVLAYALAAQLLGSGGDRWALVVAALFAIHPAHVEPFSYVSARADAVSGAFTLLAALLVALASPATAAPPVSGRRRQILLSAAACLALLLALFAKEAAAALPLALLALAVALGKLRAWAPALGLLALTVALHFPLRALLVPAAPLAEAVSAGGFIARTPGIVLQYLQMFVAPLAISNARPLEPGLFVLGWCFAGVAALALVGLAALVLARRVPPQDLRRRDVGLVAAGLVWVAAFVAPAGIAVVTLGALADRYAYVPLFGFALAVAVGLRRLHGWQATRWRLLRGLLLGTAALWTAALLFISYRERSYWQSNQALYTHAVDVEPLSPIAHYRLGVVLGGQRRWPEAAAAFSRAASTWDSPPKPSRPSAAPSPSRTTSATAPGTTWPTCCAAAATDPAPATPFARRWTSAPATSWHAPISTGIARRPRRPGSQR